MMAISTENYDRLSGTCVFLIKEYRTHNKALNALIGIGCFYVEKLIFYMLICEIKGSVAIFLFLLLFHFQDECLLIYLLKVAKETLLHHVRSRYRNHIK